jgi:D-serine deaminase-like pyridoxal phosphate-dependent protein
VDCDSFAKRFNLTQPTLILDKQRTLRNIERMARRAKQAGVRFRPHFKTHQSKDVGEWFRDVGVEAITVSSLEQAAYFARHGWSDITVAFPVNLRERSTIASLSASISLGVLVDADTHVDILKAVIETEVAVWIKIDAGYGRVGIPWDDTRSIAHIAGSIAGSSNLKLEGILAHNGHTYHARDVHEIRRIHDEAVTRLVTVKQTLLTEGHEKCAISIGDTPSCSTVESFNGIDEIRPGNFVFYDVMQHVLGVCADTDVAVAVLCPIVGLYPQRNHAALYGGAVHLSKESIRVADGHVVYGFAASPEGDSFGTLDHKAPVIALSQEHGILQLPDTRIASLRIGNMLPIYPVHSCLTANLYGEYLTLDGDILQRMPRR